MKNSSDEAANLKFRPNRTFICSVVFLDIVEYSKKSVMEQIKLKESFNGILAESLKDIPVSDRIILDTGDGAAIGFLSDPEDALFVAMSIQDAINNVQSSSMPDLLVRMGINLGPVKILKDINNQMNLIGDGINVAQRIMSFAEPGQLLVSRSYYDIVSCLSQEYAQLFQHKGARADKHVREHDIYSVENTGLRPSAPFNVPGKNTNPSFIDETLTADELPTGLDNVAENNILKNVNDQSRKNRNHLFIAVPIIAILAIFTVIFFIYKSLPDSPKATTSKKTARSTKSAKTEEKAAKVNETVMAEKTAEDKVDAKQEIFVSGSAKADDIEFIVTSARTSGDELIVSIRIRNNSDILKNVALYDDYVRWPKSKLTDQTGKTYEVSKVIFVKGGQTLTTQAAGTQGVQLSPHESVSASLTFKKIGKGIKSFSLHPFIYVGRSWKEHDLPLKINY